MTLHKHQFEPYEIYNDESMDNFIRGLVTQPTQDMDSSFSRQVLPFYIGVTQYCFCTMCCQNKSSSHETMKNDIGCYNSLHLHYQTRSQFAPIARFHIRMEHASNGSAITPNTQQQINTFMNPFNKVNMRPVISKLVLIEKKLLILGPD